MYCFKLANLKGYRRVPTAWIMTSGLINKDVWLAGGSLRTLIDPNDTICDYDLFFREDIRSHSIEDVKWHKHKWNMSDTREKLNKLGFNCTFECPEGKLYTYELIKKVPIVGKWNSTRDEKIKVQLICEHFYQTPEELLSTFDLTPCLFATDGEYFWTTKLAISDVKKKIARCFKLTYPVATIKRLIKYANKGYNVNPAIQDVVSNLIEHRDILASDSMRFYID